MAPLHVGKNHVGLGKLSSAAEFCVNNAVDGITSAARARAMQP